MATAHWCQTSRRDNSDCYSDCEDDDNILAVVVVVPADVIAFAIVPTNCFGSKTGALVVVVGASPHRPGVLHPFLLVLPRRCRPGRRRSSPSSSPSPRRARRNHSTNRRRRSPCSLVVFSVLNVDDDVKIIRLFSLLAFVGISME